MNVLDTAVNYRCQRSERVIGRSLARAFESGALRREEVVVATKGGFVPFDGARPRDLRTFMDETYIRPGILPVEALVAGCHCMAPGWIADQIERSRRNLGLETIDVYYVHNPEMQLEEVPRDEFLRRIRAAFETLEAAAAAGKIGLYGTATWDGYRKPADSVSHLSLAELVAVAREVGGADHRFRAIQLPFNLGMTEAHTARHQAGASLLAAAEAEGVYVMTSASILQGRLAKNLPDDLRKTLGPLETDAQRSLQFVRSTPGVGTALVGMKSSAHVAENLVVARAPVLAANVIQGIVGWS